MANSLQPEGDAYSRLVQLITKEQAKTSFACGGTVPVIAADDNISGVSWVATPDQLISSRPVNVFWSSKDDGSALKITLPTNDDRSSASVEKLAADCSPASFGRGGEDVLDESYRRAGKMELKDFATSFHPADFGLVQNIEQVLLPSIISDEDNSLQCKGLVADLYKLNVYSGPSGHFKAHVDTPRSDTQVGSLVVCLPSEFQGGTLLVRHGKEEMKFDWSPTSKSTIQWAAFYSDCEHEINEVTGGHRLTLTYNLHVVDVVGGAILPKPIVDPKSLPLYELVDTLMDDDNFMTGGGTMGIYCAHAYAHTSNKADKRLPKCLKGSDLVIYSVFKELGYSVSIRPVIPDYDMVGTALHRHLVDYDTEYDETEEALELWKHSSSTDIVWLNAPGHNEIALTYLAYGNESSIGFEYSYAAILVEIPSIRRSK